MPRDWLQRQWCTRQVERVTAAQGQTFLGWRKVPVNSEAAGDLARQSDPESYLAVIGRSSLIPTVAAFERKLFMIRKMAEKVIRDSALPEKDTFHITGLSSRTLIYKGMLLAHQLGAYFPDLNDPDMVSAVAIVHQRYSTNTVPAWHLAQPFRFLCHNGEINTLRGNINSTAVKGARIRRASSRMKTATGATAPSNRWPPGASG